MNSKKDTSSHTLDIIKAEDFIKELPAEEEKPKRLRKIFTIAIGTFLILLMVSYIGISYGIGDIIASLMSSETLEENKIPINEHSDSIFEGGTYQTLLDSYWENQDKEFKACLVGEITKGNYEVTEIILPEMTEQSFNRVVSKSCPEGTIVELHSHPYRRCIESEQDLKTKEIIQKTNPERLMLVMCEKYRFNFY